jgi:hypothetical protein
MSQNTYSEFLPMMYKGMRTKFYEGLRKVLNNKYKKLKPSELEKDTELCKHLDQIVNDLKYEDLENNEDTTVYTEEEKQFIKDVNDFFISRKYYNEPLNNFTFNVHLLRIYDDLEDILQKFNK